MVGKSDFIENPVVSLDLDLDFGLRLRVCQFQLCYYRKEKCMIKSQEDFIFFDFKMFDSDLDSLI